jgi:hypothetical protein
MVFNFTGDIDEDGVWIVSVQQFLVERTEPRLAIDV